MEFKALPIAIEFIGCALLSFTFFYSRGNPLVVGIVYGIMLAAARNLCKQFFNPAIMAAFYVLTRHSKSSGELRAHDLIFYAAAQVLGAISGILLYSSTMVSAGKTATFHVCKPRVF